MANQINQKFTKFIKNFHATFFLDPFYGFNFEFESVTKDSYLFESIGNASIRSNIVASSI